MNADELGKLKFPCKFPIKVMGKSDLAFEGAVIAIIRKHTPDLSEGAVTTRESKEGKFTSMTVTINATSRKQLDAIYNDLTKEDLVIMAL